VINERSVAAVDASRWQGQFVKPLYGSYCFSRLPALIESLFEDTADRAIATELLGPLAGHYQKVILLFIDGYGWRFVRDTLEQYPFLHRFASGGVITKLTSQFPSTTAVHVTTIHTGLDVGQSGIYEWFMYEPSLERIIISLPFSRSGRLEPGNLVRDGVRPETIFPTETIHQRLASRGIRSRVWGSKDFTPSPVTNVIADGADILPFQDLTDGLSQMVEAIDNDIGPGYYYLYAGNIDAIGHKSGPSSSDWTREASRTFRALEEILLPALRNRSDTLLLMTADHGQIAGDLDRTIWLNRLWPDLGRWLRTAASGAPILPTGNYRDMVMHIQEKHLEEARAGLRDRLEGRAEVVLTAELMDLGFFGQVTERLSRRIGNLMVLPFGGQLVWWEGYGHPRFRGYHGGLSPEEMETALLAWSPGAE
jgi:hypothetical protein